MQWSSVWFATIYIRMNEGLSTYHTCRYKEVGDLHRGDRFIFDCCPRESLAGLLRSYVYWPLWKPCKTALCRPPFRRFSLRSLVPTANSTIKLRLISRTTSRKSFLVVQCLPHRPDSNNTALWVIFNPALAKSLFAVDINTDYITARTAKVSANWSRSLSANTIRLPTMVSDQIALIWLTPEFSLIGIRKSRSHSLFSCIKVCFLHTRTL